MGAALFVPSFAQDNFPDTPANHWAWEALSNMKREGILVGYPDGLFRGPRNATRYELAVAINATYQKLKGMIDGLQEQVNALKGGDGVDVKSLKDQLAALQADVNAMKGWGDDVAALKKMAGTFEKELASLGVDVEAMKKDLANLEDRVTKLEKARNAVDISGDVNVWVASGNSRDGFAGLTKDGRITGVNVNDGSAAGTFDANRGKVGLTRDLNIYHEIAVRLSSTNETGPKWHGTLVYGNLLGMDANGNPTGFGDQSNRFGGFAYRTGKGQFYIQDLAVSFDTSLIGVNFSAEVGRIGAMVSPYIFARRDNSPYFKNERWDNNLWYIDGGMLGFKFGNVGLKVFGGKSTGLQTQDGTEINPVNVFVGNRFVGATIPTAGAGGQVFSTLGAVLSIPVGDSAGVEASYLIHDLVNPLSLNNGAATVQANRLNVLGATGHIGFGKVKLSGGYAKSVPMYNTKNIGMDKGNQAAWAGLSTSFGIVDLDLEYRKIQYNYGAAGTWRRIGTNWNPTNIKGFYGHVGINLTSALSLHYMGEFDKTIAATTFQKKDADIQSNQGKLVYKMNDAWNAMLGYEEVLVKGVNAAFSGGQNTRQRWASVGLGYNMGTNSMLNFGYEYGSVFNTIPWGTGPVGSYKGGFFTSQLSIKF